MSSNNTAAQEEVATTEGAEIVSSPTECEPMLEAVNIEQKLSKSVEEEEGHGCAETLGIKNAMGEAEVVVEELAEGICRLALPDQEGGPGEGERCVINEERRAASAGPSEDTANVNLVVVTVTVESENDGFQRRGPQGTANAGESYDNGTALDIVKTESKGCFSVHPLLENYKECFFNWVSTEKPLTVEEADTIASVTQEKIANVTGLLVLKQMKWRPVETVAQRLCMVFCHLVRRKFSQAATLLNEVADIIREGSKKGLIDVSCVEGLLYVFTGLEGFKNSLVLEDVVDFKKEEMRENLRVYLKQSTPYINLPTLAQAVVAGVKLVFLGNRRMKTEELELLKNILAMDPDNVEWVVNLHSISRMCRKDTDFRAGPTEEEKLAIARAIEIDANHVMVKVAVCLYLSDIIKSRTWDPENGYFELEGYGEKFESIHEMVNFMKTKSNEVLAVMDDSVKINLCIAEIFYNAMPPEFKDSHLAKKCLDAALKMNSKSSKANHRMGMFILATEKNTEKAKSFAKIAYDCDHRNFAALIDIIQILLSNPCENSTELDALFLEHVDTRNTRWPPSRFSSLQVCKGIYNFMRGHKEEALWDWLAAFNTHSSSLSSLKRIPLYCARYNWNPSDIQTSSVHQFLKEISQTSGQSLKRKPRYDECEKINTIFEYVVSNEGYGSSNRGYRDGRGRGRGYGGRGYGGQSASGWRREGGGGNLHNQGSNQWQFETPGSGIFRGNGRNYRGGAARGRESHPTSSSGVAMQDKISQNYKPAHDSFMVPRQDDIPQPPGRKFKVNRNRENTCEKVRDPVPPKPDGGRGFNSGSRGHWKRGGGGGKGKGDNSFKSSNPGEGNK